MHAGQCVRTGQGASWHAAARPSDLAPRACERRVDDGAREAPVPRHDRRKEIERVAAQCARCELRVFRVQVLGVRAACVQRDGCASGQGAFELWAAAQAREDENHAFYMGVELAPTQRLNGAWAKRYVQDNLGLGLRLWRARAN